LTTKFECFVWSGFWSGIWRGFLATTLRPRKLFLTPGPELDCALTVLNLLFTKALWVGRMRGLVFNGSIEYETETNPRVKITRKAFILILLFSNNLVKTTKGLIV